MSALEERTEAVAVVTPTRGRPREFDQDGVVDSLMNLFWRQGYEATSMNDIVHATGLNKSSLYNAFGSKRDLFDVAVAHYMEVRSAMLERVLVHGDGGLDDVLQMLEFMRAELTTEQGRRGCLAVNTATELGLGNDKVAEISALFRTRMREAFTAALNRAEAAGEIAPENVSVYARVLLAFVLGMGVVVRGGASFEEVNSQLDAAGAVISAWRITPSSPA